MLVQETGHGRVKMSFSIRAFIDRVRAVRIRDLGEGLIQADEFVHHDFAVLVMAVVVPRAVGDQELALESVHMGDRRAVLKPVLIVVR